MLVVHWGIQIVFTSNCTGRTSLVTVCNIYFIKRYARPSREKIKLRSRVFNRTWYETIEIIAIIIDDIISKYISQIYLNWRPTYWIIYTLLAKDSKGKFWFSTYKVVFSNSSNCCLDLSCTAFAFAWNKMLTMLTHLRYTFLWLVVALSLPAVGMYWRSSPMAC